MEIGHAAGLPSGTVHPILARLEGVGWLESRWEEIDPRPMDARPTLVGASWKEAAMAKPLRCRLRFHRWQRLPNPKGGWHYECVKCGAQQDRGSMGPPTPLEPDRDRWSGS